MKHSRTKLVAVLASLALVTAARAQPPCAPDVVTAQASADTIFVLHANAERNCCALLTLAVHTEGFVADFYEGEVEPFCYCMCCFDLRYEAHGFAAGHYLVRVWDEGGTVLYGQTEVDVSGPGNAPSLGWFERGECGGVAIRPTTWGGVLNLYR